MQHPGVELEVAEGPAALEPSGYLLPSLCGRLQNVLVEIQPHQALPLLSLRQAEVDHLVNAVVHGPVKLLRLVAGQDQHEPEASRQWGLGSWLTRCLPPG